MDALYYTTRSFILYYVYFACIQNTSSKYPKVKHSPMANSISPKEKLSSTILPFLCIRSFVLAKETFHFPNAPVLFPLFSFIPPARGIWLWVLNLAARIIPSAI